MYLLLYQGLRCEELQLPQVSFFDLAKGELYFEQPKVGDELRHRMHLETYLAVTASLAQDQPTGPFLRGSCRGGRLTGTYE